MKIVLFGDSITDMGRDSHCEPIAEIKSAQIRNIQSRNIR